MPLFLIDTPSKIIGENCGYRSINIENLTSIGDDATRKFCLDSSRNEFQLSLLLA